MRWLDAYMNNCGWLDGPFEKDYRCCRRPAGCCDCIGAQELFHPDSKRTEGVKWCVNTNIYAIADELEAHQ
jgi:hypothetical protein